MREGEIAVGLDAPAQPGNRFGVVAVTQFGGTGKKHPAVSEDIAGREPERLLDMGLSLLASTKKVLGHTDAGMHGGQISVQRECPLAFDNTLGRTRRINMHAGKISERPRVLRSHGQNLDQGRLSRREENGSIVGEKIGTHIEVNYRGAYHRFDVTGIERQSSFKKNTRLRQVFVG